MSAGVFLRLFDWEDFKRPEEEPVSVLLMEIANDNLGKNVNIILYFSVLSL